MKIKQLASLLVIFMLLTIPRLYGQEQLEQETISIRGNQGLPKTLYIAPWKRVGSPLEAREDWKAPSVRKSTRSSLIFFNGNWSCIRKATV